MKKGLHCSELKTQTLIDKIEELDQRSEKMPWRRSILSTKKKKKKDYKQLYLKKLDDTIGSRRTAVLFSFIVL